MKPISGFTFNIEVDAMFRTDADKKFTCTQNVARCVRSHPAAQVPSLIQSTAQILTFENS